MELEQWYVHCCKFNLEENKYDVKTLGPFSTIQDAFNVKQDNAHFDLVEVNQNNKLKLPELI